MKHCPRCHKLTLRDDNDLNSISHHSDKTYICNDCGDDESFIEAGLLLPDKNERAFVRMIYARKGAK